MPLQTLLRAFAFVTLFGSLSSHASANSFQLSYGFRCLRCGPFVGNQAVDLYTNANAVLTTTGIPVNGALTITGISGYRTTNWFMSTYSPTPITSVITGLIPPDPSNPYGLITAPDNLLYPAADPHFDLQGFAYTLTCCSGSYGSNIAQFTGQFPSVYAELGEFAVSGIETFSLTPIPTSIPEPKSLAFVTLAAITLFLWKGFVVLTNFPGRTTRR